MWKKSVTYPCAVMIGGFFEDAVPSPKSSVIKTNWFITFTPSFIHCFAKKYLTEKKIKIDEH